MNDRLNYSRSEWTWSTLQDKAWRRTIKSSYFENKAPGVDLILPAAAVIGAAAAFGVNTLLPLNVPIGKPLMYCNTSPLAQDLIKIENFVYSCVQGSFSVSCPHILEDGQVGDDCSDSDVILQCNSAPLMTELAEIYCSDGTLLSTSPIVCNSSMEFNQTVFVDGSSGDETLTVVQCYFGELPKDQASFVPTTYLETLLVQGLLMIKKSHEAILHRIEASESKNTTKYIAKEHSPNPEESKSNVSYTDDYE